MLSDTNWPLVHHLADSKLGFDRLTPSLNFLSPSVVFWVVIFSSVLKKKRKKNRHKKVQDKEDDKIRTKDNKTNYVCQNYQLFASKVLSFEKGAR